MLSIAITGGIGSGKSHVVSLLKQNVLLKDAIFLNVDTMVHALYEEPVFQQQLNLMFGTINRKEVGAIVFRDPWCRKMLEFTSGAMILNQLSNRHQEACMNDKRFFIVEVPLLYELGLQVLFAKTICVSAYDSIRMQRIINRDNRTEEQALAIIKTQLPQRMKMELADKVISNNLTNDRFLAAEVDNVAKWIVSQK